MPGDDGCRCAGLGRLACPAHSPYAWPRACSGCGDVFSDSCQNQSCWACRAAETVLRRAIALVRKAGGTPKPLTEADVQAAREASRC